MSEPTQPASWFTKRLLQKLIACAFIAVFLGIIVATASAVLSGKITVTGELDVKDFWLPAWTLFVTLVSLIVSKWLFSVAQEEAVEARR